MYGWQWRPSFAIVWYPEAMSTGEIATEPVASAGTASRPSVARSMPIICSAMFATTSAPTSRISCAKTTLTECSVAVQRSIVPIPPPSAFETQWSSSSHAGEHHGEELEYVWVGGTPTLNAPARTNGLNATGLVAGRREVELVLPVVPARQDHLHGARPVVDRHDRHVGRGRARRRVDRPGERSLRDLLRPALPVGAERRVDVEPALVQRAPPRLLRAAERVELTGLVLHDLLGEVVHEERRVLRTSFPASFGSRSGRALSFSLRSSVIQPRAAIRFRTSLRRRSIFLGRSSGS